MLKNSQFLGNVLGGYDTTINVVGGIRDYSLVFEVISVYLDNEDSVEQLIYQRNEFNLRTNKSKKRIERAINKAFLNFKNSDHQAIIKGIFQDYIPVSDKKLALFWHFALNNRLFLEISIQVFAKIFYSGRVSINKNDIIAYLKDFLLSEEAKDISWSESTINTLATKYLSFMTKLQFLKPKRNKVFEEIRISSQSLIIFLYFAKLFQPYDNNILKNQFLLLSFISHKEISNRLKKLAVKEIFNMSFDGVSLNVDFIYSYQEICNVLYDRSSSEVC